MLKQFKNLNNLIGWIVWAIATITYCLTIEPTASFWDCGEYITCAYKLEVAHPPGAPLFLIIGRLFSIIGGGDPSNAALMINILSALSSSFTILFLFWTITRLGIKSFGKNVLDLPRGHQFAVLGAGIIGALAFTFSDTFWFNAVEGEVYALSSFFTALVFWCALKWEEEDTNNPTGALRWLVLICYLIGLAIGVHLLNLLVIPAIGFVIYFKKYKFSWKGFFVTGISSVLILGAIQNLFIPKIVKFIGDYEVFFTNKLHLEYNTGTALFLLLLVVSLTFYILYTIRLKELYYKIALIITITLSLLAVLSSPSSIGMLLRALFLSSLILAIHKYKTKTITLNAVFLSFTVFLIGYSTFFILVIRSQANPPIDENNPENPTNMVAYLQRDVYGEAPILYGQYYNAPTLPPEEFGDGDPVYAKDKANNNYKVINPRKNSIPKYDSEFCTLFPRMYSSQPWHISGYKDFGNVAEHHNTKVKVSPKGDTTLIEIPTMRANLNYFFSYQLNFMYWRYFMWNFVGRQNDLSGTMHNTMKGNWITDYKSFDNLRLDSDTSQAIYRSRNNFATNHFYALPFLLGLLGIWFHFKRSKFDAWAVMCFFILTGIAIIVFLNQAPEEGRERDYAYVGSFYAFAIWIGFGVLFIYNLLNKITSSIVGAISATALSLFVPGIMVEQGWNDHDRSNRTLARDMAVNYLESCAPNSILFTNGDNDTYPLWYAQEVEGIRTDVRICNLSLMMTDWYIKQMRRAAYLSKPVPFTIPEEKLEASKLEVSYYTGKEGDELMDINKVLSYITSNDTTKKIKFNGKFMDVMPARKFYVAVDSLKVMRNKVIDVKDTSLLEKRITWDIGEKSYLLKNELMILDLLAHNDWKRPIYFAASLGDEAFIGLKKYCQLEGLAYRFVPIKQNENAKDVRVNTKVMYDNLIKKFQWGGMEIKGINLDENCIQVASYLRMQMSTLAEALINERKNKIAKEVLDKCLTVMPEENIPYDATILNICNSYYKLNENKIANELAQKLFDIYEGDLKIYNAQNKTHRVVYKSKIKEAEEMLKNLVSLTLKFKQADLNKEFQNRFGKIVSSLEPKK
jgi:hypothetical protein